MISAFGKVILSGEHAVVYGHSAVAGALSLKVGARAEVADCARLRLPDWKLDTAADDSPIGRALRRVIDGLGGTPLSFFAASDLPLGVGLGSSAALSVALVRAGAKTLGIALDSLEVERIANRAEEIFHVRPSGIDVAVATRGGIGVFSQATGYATLFARPLSIAVGVSGQPKNTAAQVATVAKQREATPARIDALLTRIGATARRTETALREDKAGDLAGALRENQALLCELGVSTPLLDRLIDAAQTAGSPAAKLTGAGGGGAVIALAPEGADAILGAWQNLGIQGFAATLGG